MYVTNLLAQQFLYLAAKYDILYGIDLSCHL